MFCFGLQDTEESDEKDTFSCVVETASVKLHAPLTLEVPRYTLEFSLNNVKSVVFNIFKLLLLIFLHFNY